MLSKYSSLSSVLSPTVKIMLTQSRTASSEITTYIYVKCAVREVHFKLNQAFKVIEVHPYWCRQKSRTVCCRNVQLMPT